MVGKALEAQRGAAGRAGVGLGMEAAIARVVVLAPAGLAHRECRHGRLGAVVGHALEDAQPRPAVGAAGERVGKAPVEGIADLCQAAPAGRKIGADPERDPVIAPARQDTEGAAAPGRELVGRRARDALDHGRGRGLGAQAVEQALERGGAADRLDHDAGAIVPDRTLQPEAVRQPIHEGPEAHALHDPGDAQAHASMIVRPS